MEDSRTRETGTSSRRTETSRLGYQSTELSPTEWTDEKHRLYLKSMEASFVNELYNSDNISSRCSPVDKLCRHSSQKMHLNTRASPGQFKVLRGAIWQKIILKKTAQLEKANGSRLPMGNSWIQHFRSSRRQLGSSLTHQDYSGADSQTRNLSGEEGLCTMFSTSPKLFPAGCLHSCHQVDSHKEVSDQNFIGEDIGGEKLGITCSEEKLKARFADASIDDQVVPLCNPATPNNLAENCAPPEGRRIHHSN